MEDDFDDLESSINNFKVEMKQRKNYKEKKPVIVGKHIKELASANNEEWGENIIVFVKKVEELNDYKTAITNCCKGKIPPDQIKIIGNNVDHAFIKLD